MKQPARDDGRDVDRQILPELVDYVFAQFPSVAVTTLGLSALIVVVFWRIAPRPDFAFWLIAVCAVTLLRSFLFVRYRSRADEGPAPWTWLRLYSAGAILAGVAWGTAPIVFFSEASPLTNVFIAFVVGGLVAGASNSMAPLSLTLALFTSLLCLPTAAMFFLEGDRPNVIMGLTFIMYGIAYVAMSSKTKTTLVDSFRLRRENLREIEERKNAEVQLRQMAQGLEEAVAQRTSELREANAELQREIEERCQAEARLGASEARYRTLVESSSDWIWEVDEEERYTYSSQSVLVILGYPPDEILGRTMYELMPSDEAERTAEQIDGCKARKAPFEGLVLRRVHRDGSERILESNGEPVFDDAGRVRGYRGIDRDVTLRVKHDEERRRVEHLESLGLLAGGIAHDFNNLLMGVFGNVELARHQVGEDSPAAQTLKESKLAIEQARNLTGQLLTFSKGGSPILRAKSVRDLVRDCCTFALSGTAIRCEYDLPEELWMAEIDEGQIWQVMDNVLKNARDAMPGGGTVWVSGRNVRAKDEFRDRPIWTRYVEISVRDEGCGISRDDLQKVFAPYFSTKKRGASRGTGIGLTVCHSVIEKHGGHIAIDSELGVGTIVSFRLPARTGGLTMEPPPPERAETVVDSCRVLLLEDDGAVAETVSRMLEGLGHVVDVVRRGEDAVERHERSVEDRQPYDFFLLDLTVRGGMGGRETLDALREKDRGVVAVVVSGYADDPVIGEWERYGFRGALVKPFRRDDLQEIMARVLPSSVRRRVGSGRSRGADGDEPHRR